MLITSIYLIANICVSLVVMEQFKMRILFNLIFSSALVGYWIYIIYLNQCVQKCLARIDKKLKNDNLEMTSNGTKKFSRSLYMLNFETQNNKASIQIRFHQINIYQPYFELRIFNLIQINFSVLFSASLLVLNYVVFLYQTN